MKQTLFLLLCLIPLCCVSCSKKTTITTRQSAQEMYEYLAQVQHEKQDAVTQWIATIPLEQRIAQLFLVNIVGNDRFVPVEYVEDIYKNGPKQHPLVPGGCILFSYNIANTPEGVMDYTDSIHDYCLKLGLIPPFVSTDQEGGVVNRLRSINGPLPSNKRVAEKLTPDQAYALYSMQANQMKALGFHLNLAPVAESISDINKDFLDDRSYGDAQKTLWYTAAAVRAYENRGIATVLKHFPGNSNTDPHTGLPEIMWTPDEIQTLVIEPFSYFVTQNPTGVLMSHARTSAFDSTTPACLSSYWVQDILRTQMKFDGIIFSDDIFMDALQKNGFSPEKAVMMAVSAGVDCIMLSEKRFAPVAKIVLDTYKKDEAFKAKIDKSVARIINYKIDQGILTVQRDGDSWSVVASQVPNRADRMQTFIENRDKNIQLYRTYFMD